MFSSICNAGHCFKDHLLLQTALKLIDLRCIAAEALHFLVSSPFKLVVYPCQEFFCVARVAALPYGAQYQCTMAKQLAER